MKMFKKISPVPLVPTAAPAPTYAPPDVEPWVAPEPDGGIDVAGTLLYADSDDGIPGHYKQWHIWMDREPTAFLVSVAWGKVGAKQQTKTYRYGIKWEAERFMQKMIASKRAKGYRDKR